MNIQDIRNQDPRYQNLSDFELTDRLHQQHYPQMEFSEFARRVELEPASLRDGVANSLLSGAMLGFADEAQALIAAAVASPFVSDQSFAELYGDAVNSIRQEQAQFAKERPKTAFAGTVAGGLVTGGVGAARATGVQSVRALAAGRQALPSAGRLAGTGAALGGTAGAGFSDAPEFLSLDTALGTAIGAGAGAAIGVAAPKVIGAVSASVRRILGRPRIQVLDDTGQFTQEAIDELGAMVRSGRATQDDVNQVISENLRKAGVLTEEQVQRFNLFQRRGVTPNRANVTGSTDDQRALQNALKRTGPVSRQVAEQDAQIAGTVARGVDDIGPVAQNLPEANARVFAAVDKIVSAVDDQVTQAYRAAEQAAQGQPRVTITNLAKAISDNRGHRLARDVISGVRQELKNKGLIREGSFIDINKRGQRVTDEDVKLMTVREAEEIRQSLNAMFDSVTPFGRRMIRTLKNALDDDVAEAVGEDIFADARAAKVAFQRLIERGRRNKFDKTRGGFLEDVIDNKTDEGQIIPKLLRGRSDDFNKFKAFLTQEAGPDGIQAWNDIRAHVLRDALDKATRTMGRTEGGDAVFNANVFRRQFESLRQKSGGGGVSKFEQLFNADERALIDDVVEIGLLRIPQRAVASGSGPTAAAVESMRGAILRKLPFGERAQDLVDAVANVRADRRLLDVTGPTARALNR